jgi:hypothetical protein
MVYNTEKYWVSELCPSSGILETIKHNASKMNFFRPQVKWVPPTLFGISERHNLSHLTTHVKVKVKVEFSLRLAVDRQSPTTTKIPDIRLCRGERIAKYATNFVIKLAQT